MKVSSDLAVLDIFTPFNVDTLDHGDLDFGSGGLLVLPDMPGATIPHLAVAAGKDGNMYILNRDKLGGFDKAHVNPSVWIGNCWCGPSYFVANDSTWRGQTARNIKAEINAMLHAREMVNR